MKKTYDRLAAGERIRIKRTLLGFTQDEVAEKINRAPKYYADIERGSCGMSIETLLALSETLNMNLDYILFGKTHSEKEFRSNTNSISAVIELLDSSEPRKQKYALALFKVFLAAYDDSHSSL